jgi:hypothetical protein
MGTTTGTWGFLSRACRIIQNSINIHLGRFMGIYGDSNGFMAISKKIQVLVVYNAGVLSSGPSQPFPIGGMRLLEGKAMLGPLQEDTLV